MRIWSRAVWLASASVAGAAIVVACSNNAVGVQACRQIETARCEAAPACAASFTLSSQPVPDGDPVAACVRYYNDACLHGMATSVAPSNIQVNQCVAVIAAAGKAAATERDSGAACTTVAYPQNSAACAFLIPIDSGTPAVADAASDDAGSVAEDAGD